MSTPRKGYRTCTKCKRNRADKFFKTARGRVCVVCQKKRTQFASREVRLMETYGITLEEYAELLAEYDGECWICGGKRPYNLDVDHDHAVEKQLIADGVDPVRARRLSIRGLLCKPCNRRLLPSVRDKIATLQSAIDYIKYARHDAQAVLA